MSDQKRCIDCGEMKSLRFYYKHSGMADGHLNKCKECQKRAMRRHRRDNSEKVAEVERWRESKPKRRAYVRQRSKNYKETDPEKHRAHAAVREALRKGALIKEPCKICGDPDSEAHHPDYSKPLDVEWYCSKHHHAVHVIMRGGK